VYNMQSRVKESEGRKPFTGINFSRVKYPAKATILITDDDAKRSNHLFEEYDNSKDPKEAGFLRYIFRLGLDAAEKLKK